MVLVKPNKTFIIKHKKTGELFRAKSGKTSWKAAAHAKSAFGITVGYLNFEEVGLSLVDTDSKWTRSRVPFKEYPKFDEQDVYEIVELKMETETQLDKAIELLQEFLRHEEFLEDCSRLKSRTSKFLKEVKK